MKGRKDQYAFVILLLISLALLLVPREIFNTFRLRIYSIYASVTRPVVALGEETTPNIERSRGEDSLERRLEDSERREKEYRAALELALAQLSETRGKLRQIIELKEYLPNVSASPARIIGRQRSFGTRGFSQDSGIIIDKGLLDGISQGSAVLQGQSVAGQVVECRDRASQVLLINSPRIIMAARLGKDRTECYVRGAKNGGCEAVFLTMSPKAEKGDLVFTSGLLGYCPADVIIGTLAETPVLSEDRKSMVAGLTPYARLDALDMILVLGRTDHPAAEFREEDAAARGAPAR